MVILAIVPKRKVTVKQESPAIKQKHRINNTLQAKLEKFKRVLESDFVRSKKHNANAINRLSDELLSIHDTLPVTGAALDREHHKRTYERITEITNHIVQSYFQKQERNQEKWLERHRRCRQQTFTRNKEFIPPDHPISPSQHLEFVAKTFPALYASNPAMGDFCHITASKPNLFDSTTHYAQCACQRTKPAGHFIQRFPINLRNWRPAVTPRPLPRWVPNRPRLPPRARKLDETMDGTRARFEQLLLDAQRPLSEDEVNRIDQSILDLMPLGSSLSNTAKIQKLPPLPQARTFHLQAFMSADALNQAGDRPPSEVTETSSPEQNLDHKVDSQAFLEQMRRVAFC